MDPIWLWIDPTRRCNLACELCYTKASHADEDLSVEGLKTYLGKILDAGIVIKELTLNWRGEPLMNKRFTELLDTAVRMLPNTPLQFHTNAMLLTQKVAAELVNVSGHTRIFLSIDGGTRESHEQNRGVNTFKPAISGALTLLRTRGTSGSPKIFLYQIDLGIAEDSYEKGFTDVAKLVDSHIRVPPVLEDGRETSTQSVKESQIREGFIARKNWDSGKNVNTRRACFWAGNSLSVAPNGDVSICILSNTGDGVIGNLRSESVETIYARAKKWREQLNVHGRRNTSHCAKCEKCEGNANSYNPI